MPNKKLPDFPSVTTLQNNDIFLIESAATTSTVSYGTLSSSIINTSFNALLSSKGWQKLPSGLIMQWGDLPTTDGNRQSVSVVFAIPFPTAVVSFNITANTNNRSTNAVNVWSVYDHNLTGFTARTQDTDATPYEGWWVAMGY